MYKRQVYVDVRPLETTAVDSLTNRFADKSVPYQVKRIGTVIVPTVWSSPPVRDMTMSKTDREPIMLVMTLIRIEGPKSGMVIYRKADIPEAPSIFPASYSSVGMDCRPAR